MQLYFLNFLTVCSHPRFIVAIIAFIADLISLSRNFVKRLDVVGILGSLSGYGWGLWLRVSICETTIEQVGRCDRGF